jgi:hypothetical protein
LCDRNSATLTSSDFPTKGILIGIKRLVMPKPDPSKTKLTGIRAPVIQKPNQQQFLPFPSPTEGFPQSDQQN